jgi:TLC domain
MSVSSSLLSPTAAAMFQAGAGAGAATTSVTTTTAAIPLSSNDYISNIFLQCIYYIDTQYGANEWNLRHVAIITAIILFSIKIIVSKKGGIDWYAFVHSIISAIGALICFYLDEYASSELTGVSEPLRSLQCTQSSSIPLTSIHRIIPAITMGYAVIDMLDGIFYYGSLDFVIHGMATFGVLYYFVETISAPHIVAPMLILECSTVFLNILGIAPLLPSILSVAVVGSFAIAFFIFRIVLFPYIHIRLMMHIIEQQQINGKDNYCYPQSFFWVCLLFGMTFHCLNFYWFYKIMLKLKRKILGVEKFTDKNSCADYNDHEKEEKVQQQHQQQQLSSSSKQKQI